MSCSFAVDRGVASMLRPGDRARLRRTFTRMVAAAGLAAGGEALEASLRLVDDETIWVFNRAYRHKDKPTDVLAFAVREGQGGELVGGELGDVIISLPTAKGQAKTRTHAGFLREVEFLAAHGLCHLLGYDHPTARAEAKMNTRMEALLVAARRPGKIQAA